MLNPYVCKTCMARGRSSTAWYLIRFQDDLDGEEPLPICEECFSKCPPNEFQSIENLHVTLAIEGGCCG